MCDTYLHVDASAGHWIIFFLLLLSSLLCYGSICHSAWSDISAGLVGSTCSTPTHSQSGDYMLMHSCLGLHAHAAMPSFLYNCCPYPYIGNTFTRWDVSIPPYIHTVFSAQERANKFPHSYPEAFWYRNRSLGDWKPSKKINFVIICNFPNNSLR